MKKKLLFIVLFVILGLIGSGIYFIRNEDNPINEHSVRTIQLEDEKIDLSYYEDKYDIYNEENKSFLMTESYLSDSSVVGKNANTTELKVEFNAYVNKEEAYFTFSYKACINNELVLENEVKIELKVYENKLYLVSSNGYVTSYDAALKGFVKGDCAAFTYATIEDCTGLNDLGGLGYLGSGGGGAAAAGGLLGLAAAAALGSGSGTGVSTTGGAAAGSIPPGGNKNNNKKKKSLKEIIDSISDEYKQNGQCNKFADKLELGMRKNGISGERIKATPKTSRGFMCSDQFGYLGDNGFHEGIKVGDIIYDNLRPEGIPYSEWIEDLGGEYWINIFKTIIG